MENHVSGVRFLRWQPIVTLMGSLVRLIAITTSILVVLGFAYFATDEMNRGSQNQQAALDSELKGKNTDPTPIAPTAPQEAARERATARSAR